MKKPKDYTLIVLALYFSLIVLAFSGWVKCIIKLTKCDFEAPYKAEAIYATGVFTGTGVVIGWINIDDKKK